MTLAGETVLHLAFVWFLTRFAGWLIEKGPPVSRYLGKTLLGFGWGIAETVRGFVQGVGFVLEMSRHMGEALAQPGPAEPRQVANETGEVAMCSGAWGRRSWVTRVRMWFVVRRLRRRHAKPRQAMNTYWLEGTVFSLVERALDGQWRE